MVRDVSGVGGTAIHRSSAQTSYRGSSIHPIAKKRRPVAAPAPGLQRSAAAVRRIRGAVVPSTCTRVRSSIASLPGPPDRSRSINLVRPAPHTAVASPTRPRPERRAAATEEGHRYGGGADSHCGTTPQVRRGGVRGSRGALVAGRSGLPVRSDHACAADVFHRRNSRKDVSQSASARGRRPVSWQYPHPTTITRRRIATVDERRQGQVSSTAAHPRPPVDRVRARRSGTRPR